MSCLISRIRHSNSDCVWHLPHDAGLMKETHVLQSPSQESPERCAPGFAPAVSHCSSALILSLSKMLGKTRRKQPKYGGTWWAVGLPELKRTRHSQPSIGPPLRKGSEHKETLPQEARAMEARAVSPA